MKKDEDEDEEGLQEFEGFWSDRVSQVNFQDNPKSVFAARMPTILSSSFGGAKRSFRL